MTNLNNKFLNKGSEVNPFVAMAEMGVSPKEMKEFIIEVLSPYFENKSIVEQLSIELLGPEVVNLFNIRICDDEYLLQYVLNIYREAKSINEELSFQACADSEQAINDGLSHYMSLYLMESSKSELGLHEFSLETFKIIGSLIEACLKPFLPDLLCQLRICRTNAITVPPSLKLGVMVQEIQDKIDYKELMAPAPFGIKLSQWRNIAQHHNVRVRGNVITCTYGEGARAQEVDLSREDLMGLSHKVMSIYRVIKLARTIYFLDNLDEIKLKLPQLELREESRLLSFVTAAATQGFKVIKLNISDNTDNAQIEDLQPACSARLAHASQLLLPLWEDTKRAQIEVSYEVQNQPYRFEFSVNGSFCRQLAEEQIDVEHYLDNVEFQRVQISA